MFKTNHHYKSLPTSVTAIQNTQDAMTSEIITHRY